MAVSPCCHLQSHFWGGCSPNFSSRIRVTQMTRTSSPDDVTEFLSFCPFCRWIMILSESTGQDSELSWKSEGLAYRISCKPPADVRNIFQCVSKHRQRLTSAALCPRHLVEIVPLIHSQCWVHGQQTSFSASSGSVAGSCRRMIFTGQSWSDVFDLSEAPPATGHIS